MGNLSEQKQFYNAVEDTIANLLNGAWHFNNLVAHQLWNRFVKLGRIAFQLRQIAVVAANNNCDLTTVQQKHRDGLWTEAIKILEGIGLLDTYFNFDPRYSMIRVSLPGKQSNCVEGVWALPEAPFLEV